MSTTIKNTGGSSVVSSGLNVSKITAIEGALDAYIKSITGVIHVAASKKNIALAIKGTGAQAEAQKYIASMDKACEELFRNVDRYKKMLEQAKVAYANNDKFNV